MCSLVFGDKIKIYAIETFDPWNLFLSCLQHQFPGKNKKWEPNWPFVSLGERGEGRANHGLFNWDWFHAGCFGSPVWLSGISGLCPLWHRTVPLCQAERRDSFFLLACHVIVVIVICNCYKSTLTGCVYQVKRGIILLCFNSYQSMAGQIRNSIWKRSSTGQNNWTQPHTSDRIAVSEW